MGIGYKIYDGTQSAVFDATIIGSDMEFVLKVLSKKIDLTKDKESKFIEELCPFVSKPEVKFQGKTEDNSKTTNHSHLNKDASQRSSIESVSSLIKRFNEVADKCLTTPFIVVGDAGGYPYFVMKKYKTSLEDYIKIQNLEVQEIYDITLKLIKLVKKIHMKGIQHRDLKPDNILMDDKNNLKISDFGLSCKLKNDHECLFDNGNTKFYFPYTFFKDNYYLDNPTQVDYYSVGMIFLRMTTPESKAYLNNSRYNTIDEMADLRKYLRKNKNISEKVKHLIYSLLRMPKLVENKTSSPNLIDGTNKETNGEFKTKVQSVGNTPVISDEQVKIKIKAYLRTNKNMSFKDPQIEYEEPLRDISSLKKSLRE